MGACTSSDPIPVQNVKEEAYIIHLINSSNIPTKGVDLLDGIQAYCVIKVKTTDGLSKNNEFSEQKTTIRHSSNEPIWNAYRKIIASQNDVIHIELFDQDIITDDDYLGEAILSVNNDLKYNEIITLPFKMKKQFAKFGSNIKLKIFHENDYSFKSKKIYFLRHAESEFNVACQNVNVVDMWSKTDHPLTDVGIKQCLSFNEKMNKIIDDNDDEYSDFLTVDSIWTSPLCRAVQSSFISLNKHPILTCSGLFLLSNCREFKSIGGRDCVSSSLGKQIKERALDKLKKYKDDDFISSYNNISFDYNDTLSKWWSGLNDKSKSDINERFNDFANFLRYRQETKIIIVTHSVFIRYFFGRYLPMKQDKYYDDDIKQDLRNDDSDDDDDDDDDDNKDIGDDDDDEYNKRLVTWKVENCGLIKVNIEFDDKYRDGLLVKNTKLMFGSKMIKRGRNKSK